MSKKYLKEFLIICFGNFLIAVGVKYFILPFDILTGGVAGLAVALSPFVPLSKEIIIDILVVGLFIVGWIILGKEFAIKTFISSIIYPVFISLLGLFPVTLDISPLLASIYSGVFSGVGIGIVLRCGASTGGMDIPPLVINHYTGIETSTLILITDGLTSLLGLLNYPIESLLNGLISVVLSSILIGKIEVAHGSDSLSVQIISSEWEKINSEILKQLDRGVTVMDIQGGYTMKQHKMLMVIIDKREYSTLLDILEQYDKNAFVITNSVQSVHGEGFKWTYK